MKNDPLKEHRLGNAEKLPSSEVVAMLGNFKVHPFTESFPKYEDVDALRSSISLIGQQHPIVFWRDSDDPEAPLVLVDGRHRIKAWGGDQSRLKYIVYTCREIAIIDFIMATNFHHRHLEPGQIAMIEAEAKKRIGELQKRGRKLKKFCTGAELPTPTETSPRTQASANNVVAHGSAKLKEAATDGKIGVKPAEQAAKKLTPEAQDELVARVSAGEKPAAAIQQLLGDETKRKPEAAAPPKRPDLVYTVTVPTFAGDIDRHIAALDCLLAEKFYGAEFTIKLR